MKRKCLFLILIFFISASLVNAQDTSSADAFFSQVSANFGSIRDYQANIQIRSAGSGNLIMEGTVIYRRPIFLKIDFTGGQVFVANNEKVIWYVPSYSFILEQELYPKSDSSLQSLASSKGLNYLRNHYSTSFVSGPDMTPLDNGSGELVYKLRLFSGGRTIEISINSHMMIRRIVTGSYIVDYTNIQINTNIASEQFDYTPPSNANVYENFLYEPAN
jgi:outer membrane lipoprotein-sorting protein